MGASPKTKADYRIKIAQKQSELERLKALLVEAKERQKRDRKNGTASSHGPDWVRGQIAGVKGEIARLKAEMANAPKG